jgi:hypothetical protein
MLASVAGLKRATDALHKAASTLGRADGYESLHRIERLLAELDRAVALPDALRADAQAASQPTRAWLAAEWGRRGSLVARDTADHFAARGVACQLEGARLTAGAFVVLIDAAKDKGSVEYAGEEIVAGLPLVPERLFAGWQGATAALERGETPPEQFADLLAEAAASLAKGEPRVGSRIPLPDIHFELFVRRQTAAARTNPSKGRLKEYPRSQFAWDLARLRAAPHFLERAGRRMELLPASPSAARSRVASVLVVDEGGGTVALADLRMG